MAVAAPGSADISASQDPEAGDGSLPTPWSVPGPGPGSALQPAHPAALFVPLKHIRKGKPQNNISSAVQHPTCRAAAHPAVRDKSTRDSA